MSEEAVDQQVQDAPAPEAQNEPSDIAKELASLGGNEAEADESLDGVSTDIEVPVNDFWDNADSKNRPTEDVEAEPASSDEVTLEGTEDVSQPTGETISYKANGEEIEISLDEARKKLAMSDGGAKAFSKLAQANKELAQYKEEIGSLREKADVLDKLEEVKHDWRAIIQIATGQDPDTFIEDVARKNNILKNGTEVEKAALEREDRLAALERKLAADEKEVETRKQREAEREASAEKQKLKTMLDGEFFKHKFNLGDDVRSNEVNEMLWHEGRNFMTRYVSKYKDHPKFDDLLPKMAEKSFQDAADKLKRLTSGSVQAEVTKAIEAKKQTAKEKAAVASSRRIDTPSFDDFKGLGVREIADKLLGKKKFSLE